MDQTKFQPKEQPKQMTYPGRPRVGLRKRKRAVLEPGFPKPCEECNIVLQRKVEYDAHIIGKRHMKMLRKKELQEKLEKEQAAEAVPGSDKKTKDLIVIDPKTSFRTCTVCSIKFESPQTEQNHVNGKKHKIKVQKLLTRCSQPIPPKNGSQPMPPKKGSQPKPPKRGYVGRCEVCQVNYTSPEIMKTHLLGKKHNKKLRKQGQVETAVPTQTLDAPFPKKIKLQPVITPSLPKTHELLEKQAEEAYEKYKSVATIIPHGEAQALYLKYQSIYRAYEAAYHEYMASKEGKK